MYVPLPLLLSPVLPVLAAGHVWILSPAAPADAWLWDPALPHAETQLEPGELLPGELCLPSSQGMDVWVLESSVGPDLLVPQSFSSANTSSASRSHQVLVVVLSCQALGERKDMVRGPSRAPGLGIPSASRREAVTCVQVQQTANPAPALVAFPVLGLSSN